MSRRGNGGVRRERPAHCRRVRGLGRLAPNRRVLCAGPGSSAARWGDQVGEQGGQDGPDFEAAEAVALRRADPPPAFRERATMIALRSRSRSAIVSARASEIRRRVRSASRPAAGRPGGRRRGRRRSRPGGGSRADVPERERLHVRGGVGRDEPVDDRAVQADDERLERVVERLGRPPAGAVQRDQTVADLRRGERGSFRCPGGGKIRRSPAMR